MPGENLEIKQFENIEINKFEELQNQLDEKDKTITSYAIAIENLKRDLNKKSEMINLLKALLREVL